MIVFFEKIQQNFKFRSLDMLNHTPKVQFEMQMGQYTLKTATEVHELKSAFKLRHRCFYGGTSEVMDIDEFDSVCDHLIIVDQKTQKVVGTYRMNNSTSLFDFYSHTEFDMKSFILPYTNFVELGRACIDAQHRNGIVITLLWKGIYFYMKHVKADVLFGCSSIKNATPEQAALIYRYFQQKGLINSKYQIKPRLSYKVPLFEENYGQYQDFLSESQIKEAESLIPSLLKSYIKAGAEILGEPAFDPDMNTIDFLTCLKTQNLAQKFERKFERMTS